MKKQHLLLALCAFLFAATACQKKEDEPKPMPLRVNVVLELDDEVKQKIDASLIAVSTTPRSGRIAGTMAAPNVVGGIDVSDVVQMTDAQWAAEGYTRGVDYGDLSSSVRNNIMGAFRTDLESWVIRAENSSGTDAQIIADLKNTIRQSYNRSGTYSTYETCICTVIRNGRPQQIICNRNEQPGGYVGQTCQQTTYHAYGLTETERTVLQQTFYGVEQYMDQVYTQLIPYALADAAATAAGARRGGFWRNLGDAFLRVALGVAVVAAVTVLVVSGVGLAGGLVVATTKLAAVKATISTVLIKGTTVGSFQVQSVLLTGVAGGLKNAVKNWGYPWQGSSEFVFGIKLKPVYS